MESRGLLFIPDISGFTRFVNQTDIDHSRLIIQELLEILINANDIGLEVSEVEGDAILFYKFGNTPALGELYHQVEKMFTEFHRHLSVYEINRFCQCKACRSAINLTLKVITHYGEFTGYNVKQFNKLIGKDVIVAHQLLKNEIDQHEYWLITDSLLPGNEPTGLKEWMQWMSSIKQTESGSISYHYTQLGPLKDKLPPVPLPELTLANKVKILTLTRDYDVEIIPLFHATGDIKYRSAWQEGVKEVEGITHFLPRVGMRSRRIFENGDAVVFASSYTFNPERIEFSETDENKKNATYFILEKISANRTRLTVEDYIHNDWIRQVNLMLFGRRRLARTWSRSLDNLDAVAKSIKLPAFIED